MLIAEPIKFSAQPIKNISHSGVSFDFPGLQPVLKNVPNETPDVCPGILGRATPGPIPYTPKSTRTVRTNLKIGKKGRPAQPPSCRRSPHHPWPAG
eukprot:9108611-Pyramimonas_sp.AAC.1